ncbi:hypothetical protein HXX76_008525 [Chlamydomonas incerta]|uniref:3'-5' exonuclease domain-containing protein n=1 Tax=Chlamydomonas incerta TaxID=51695 RepID=A0A835VYN8_CHLIN|nr:hypothetical protein HXX76_008525 [Chlamydomonas incerta]|eukprot:KAG2432790.1 hypothetical protein HXX76_008525 [Chlamydomonas incerta]
MVIPEVDPAALLPGSAIVKSIVLMVGDAPLVAVVLLKDRVDERKIADLMQLARRRVRLAKPEEVLRATGFVVGTVPPFGHIREVPTLVDTAVTRMTRLYGGGGDPEKEVEVGAAELLQYCRGRVADVTATVAGPAESSEEDVMQAAGARLPLPWPRGSELVSMVCVVATRRRIAKLLQFSNVIPEQGGELGGLALADGQAVYLRRLWQNPDTGAPAEVQLIMGKTLERALGREQAQALLDQIKVGSILAITGRVQPSLAKSPLSSAPAAGAVDNTSSSRQQLRADVMDVVCSSVTILHKSRDHLNKALRAAKRAGLGFPASAGELLEVQQAAAAVGATASGTSVDLGARYVTEADEDDVVEDEEETTVKPESLGRPHTQGEQVARDGGVTSAIAGRDGGQLRGRVLDAAASRAVGPASDTWQMQLPPGGVQLVATAEQVHQMRREVLGGLEAESAALAGAPWQVVAIDCEWAPYERNQPNNPVSILQVGTRDRIYIVDLLQLLQPHSTAAAADACGGAVSGFLTEVLSSPRLVVVGFQLRSDLDRLQESYPHLTCFKRPWGSALLRSSPAVSPDSSADGGNGAEEIVVPRMCVDLVDLARALRPDLSRTPQISLSRLVNLVLGKPLDKEEQRSQWAARPLSESQLSYAAADVACLVSLFDALVGHAAAPAAAATSDSRAARVQELGPGAAAAYGQQAPGPRAAAAREGAVAA